MKNVVRATIENDSPTGPYAFSEKESMAVKQATEALGNRMIAFFSLHSYSQLWMSPYGYTYKLPADYTEMVSL